ncbi:hypothetical protein OH77DRAFT_112757 [Trametes cingulata]|nr:hypothetical protein OH77DRAFT_112757 [Trametes cingulata]
MRMATSYDADSFWQTEGLDAGLFGESMDRDLTEESLDTLFDDFIRPDACSSNASSAGGVPHLMESVLEPYSPTWLFDLGTPEGRVTIGCASNIRQMVDTSTVADGDGVFPWPPSTSGMVQDAPMNEREEQIAEDIPYVSDILAQPRTSCLHPTPSAPLGTVPAHLSTDVEILDAVVAPSKIVVELRTQPCCPPCSSPYTRRSTSSSCAPRPELASLVRSPPPSPYSRRHLPSSSLKSYASRSAQIPLEVFAAGIAGGLKGRSRCPFCAKHLKRYADLNRHVATHCREGAHLLDEGASASRTGWVRCTGVPSHIAARYGITDVSTSHVTLVDGVEMVGGCGKRFSRPDSLKRHLRNANNACVGEAISLADKRSVCRYGRKRQ